MKFLASILSTACLFGFSNALFNEVNMFSAVSRLSSDRGVKPTAGYHSNSTAYFFNKLTEDLIANTQATVDAAKLIHESHDFVISAYAKVDPSAIYGSNTIVSIISQDGQENYFLVGIRNTNRKKLKIEFSFRSKGDLKSITTLETKRRIEVDKWHKVELRVQDSERLVKVLVDDELVEVELFEDTFDSIPTNAQLRLAQTFLPASEGVPKIKHRFQGSLQDVKIKLGIKKCKTIPKPCKCPVPGGNQCIMNGVEYKEGDQWQKDNCTRCLCRKNKIINVYTCQPCSEGNDVYLHGDIWINSKCEKCQCKTGTKTCSPIVCPKPNCPKPEKSGRTITLPGKCCPICVEDQCNGTGKVYRKCGCDKTCATLKRACPSSSCKEGCFCPDNYILKSGKCLTSFNCGCIVNKTEYKDDGSIWSQRDGCVYCMCQSGEAKCRNFC